eukprot:TRINITY_DN21783_c0_g2_i1.p1 TRINITY_DN21783_c0_g2~~TRINITY_DN21783_c0_g2_i1.p1  ORF type:complete len:524 (-),score=107.07 TRINITY_DN21783_c0_g2_i1:95-1612(-)
MLAQRPLDVLKAAIIQKGPTERLLQKLSALAASALQSLDVGGVEDKVPDAADVQKARDSLGEVERTVRKLREEIKNRHKATPRISIADGAEVEPETRNWLTRFYTDVDVDAADANQAIALKSPIRKAILSFSNNLALKSDLARIISNAEVASDLEKVGQLEFDAIEMCAKPLVLGKAIAVVGAHLVRRNGFTNLLEEQGSLLDSGPNTKDNFDKSLVSFFMKLDDNYKKDVPYHGAHHAVDVASCVDFMMLTPFMVGQTTSLDHFMADIAGLIHDVGHPGKTAAFVIKSMDPLALRYNDRSVLENMHVSLSFSIMKDHPLCNWFEMLQGSTRDYVRRGLIDMVLGTDMSKHAAHVKSTVSLVEESAALQEDEVPQVEDKQQLLDTKLTLLGTVLHAADISNPGRPQKVMLSWTERLMKEYWACGDDEKSQGLDPSPFCDRHGKAGGMATVPTGQLGFINFVVQPYFRSLATLIPELQAAVGYINESKSFWSEKEVEEATYEQIFG